MDPQSYAAFGRIRLFLSDLQLVLGGLANSPFYGYGQVPTSRGKPTQRSRAWMEKRRTAPMQPAQTTRAIHERFSGQTPPPDKASKSQQQLPTQVTSARPAAAMSRSRSLHWSRQLRYPVPPKPRPTRIRVTNPRAYMTCPSSLHQPVIRKIRYKQHVPRNPAQSQTQDPSDVDEDQDQEACSARYHSEAESDVQVDVGPHNQTLFGFPPLLVPTHLTVNGESDRLSDSFSDQADSHIEVDPSQQSDYHNDSDCGEDGTFTEPDNELDQPNPTEYSDYHSSSNHEVTEVHDQPEATNQNDNHDYTTNINESNSYHDFNDDYAESEIYHDNPGEFYNDSGGYDDDGGYDDGGGYDCDDGGDYGLSRGGKL